MHNKHTDLMRKAHSCHAQSTLITCAKYTHHMRIAHSCHAQSTLISCTKYTYVMCKEHSFDAQNTVSTLISHAQSTLISFPMQNLFDFRVFSFSRSQPTNNCVLHSNDHPLHENVDYATAAYMHWYRSIYLSVGL